jgi:hypothetical protein
MKKQKKAGKVVRISYRATREEIDFLARLAETECLPSRESVIKRLIRKAMIEEVPDGPSTLQEAKG